jgi:hypothetical protein
MTSITIRRLENSVKKRLRLHDLAQAIRRRFEPLGGIELELPPRQPMRDSLGDLVDPQRSSKGE